MKTKYKTPIPSRERRVETKRNPIRSRTSTSWSDFTLCKLSRILLLSDGPTAPNSCSKVRRVITTPSFRFFQSFSESFVHHFILLIALQGLSLPILSCRISNGRLNAQRTVKRSSDQSVLRRAWNLLSPFFLPFCFFL